MSEQTKIYRLLPWAVATVIVIAVISAASYFNFSWPNIYSLTPWENAQGVDTARAINEFGEGILDSAAYWESRVAILAGLIVLFVVGPSLWIFSEIQNQAKEVSSRNDELKKGTVWYAGVMIVIAGLIYAVPVTAMKGFQFQNIWESAEKSRNLDELRSGLTTLAFDAAELYYLSHSADGEGGFYAISGKDGEPGKISLEDMESYTNLAKSENSYVLAPVESDSVITIYGVGYKQGTYTDFENANGEQGKVQLAIKVVPEDEIVQWSNNNTNKP